MLKKLWQIEAMSFVLGFQTFVILVLTGINFPLSVLMRLLSKIKRNLDIIKKKSSRKLWPILKKMTAVN